MPRPPRLFRTFAVLAGAVLVAAGPAPPSVAATEGAASTAA
ncbi:hypothetical protein [Streptomyces sp. NPDC055189]